MASGMAHMAGERPTLDTIAAAAGVSRMTVSNAYNRPDQLSAATRKRVLETARRLGYSGPDPTAASLRLGRTGTVGVVLTEQLPDAFADPGLVTILHGITTELSDAGNALLLVPAHGADGGSLVRRVMVDALILCSLAADDPAVRAARERQVPLVTVGRPRLAKVRCVGADDRRAAAEVARYLLHLNHRSFAVLTTATGGRLSPSRPIFLERVGGFRDALIGAGVDPGDIDVLCAADHSRAAGHHIVGELLSRSAAGRASALFAVTDILALGVLDAATDAGLTIPRDLSVVGFDDITAAATSTPPLTTVAHDLFGQGRAAARMALGLIAGESVRAPRVAAELVIRDSTAAIPVLSPLQRRPQAEGLRGLPRHSRP
jgi:DNA-binding LacI/PurR family transcriptional regulator